VESHFLAGILRPLFWLLVLIPLLAALRWALGKYLAPRLSPRVRSVLFRKV
jgi:hypothetical protein